MSSDKAGNKHAGAPAAKKPSQAGFDLFKTFRHSPKPADPVRAPKAETKPEQ